MKLIMRLAKLSGYPLLVVFMLAGFSAVIVAYASYNLLSSSMENLRFLRQHGWLAIMSGGLLQILQIAGHGILALFFYFVFKVCESEILVRYRRWQDK